MLSIRLQQVLKYISSDDYVADIGCDHGYLTIAAIEKGVKFVQLIDNKEGPLKVAKKNLQQFEDIAQVIYTHADGLSNLNHLINVACICGMGGDLIYHIIENSLAKAQNLDFLILQANSKVEFLRENLANLKFEIMDEQIVYDKKKYYQIMQVKYNPQMLPLSKKQILFGPILLEKRNQIFLDYLYNKLTTMNAIIENKTISSDNLSQLKEKKEMIEEVLNETI